MGDRSNVSIISQYDGTAVLYSHWGGTRLFEVARQALDSTIARNRWNDPPYLRRIIFQTILAKDGLQETGFGISGNIGDNEYKVMVIDTDSQRVAFVDEGSYGKPLADNQGWTFEEFVGLSNVEQYG